MSALRVVGELPASPADSHPSPAPAGLARLLLVRRSAPRPRQNSGPLVAAAAALVALLAIGVAVGSGLVRLPWMAGPVASAPPLTVSPSGSPAATASSSVAPVSGLRPNGLVRTAVTGLTVREMPGTSGRRLGSLADGALSFVVDGPRSANGYAWYQLAGLGLPANTGCVAPSKVDPFECPLWFGWVASASPQGDPWLTAAPDACAGMSGSLEKMTLGIGPLLRLHCLAGQSVTFRGWWPKALAPAASTPPQACPGIDATIAWLACAAATDSLVVIGPQTAAGPGIVLALRPGGGVGLPARGQWVAVTGHLDDPAASQCGTGMSGDAALRAVLGCRAALVPTKIEVVSGP